MIIVVFGDYQSKQPVRVLRCVRWKGRTRREEKFVGFPIRVLVGTKRQRPETSDLDWVAINVLHVTQPCSRIQVEGINLSSLKSMVALHVSDQKSITEYPKVGGSQSDAPRRLERPPRIVVGEASKQIAVGIKNSDGPAALRRVAGKGREEFAVDVLNAIDIHVKRRGRVRERTEKNGSCRRTYRYRRC
jgi:hypothetical protein